MFYTKRIKNLEDKIDALEANVKELLAIKPFLTYKRQDEAKEKAKQEAVKPAPRPRRRPRKNNGKENPKAGE